jgi:hypothetical protein
MKVNPFYTVLTSLLIGMCCIQCTLDEGNPGTSDPALTLRVDSEFSLINLSWTPVKVTGFKEYIILQSSGEIPNSPTPPVGQDVTVLARINIINDTTFSATNILFSPTSCYKLYCKVDERFLYSSTVCIEQSTIITPGFNDRADHAPDVPQIALFDRSNIKLTAFTDEDGTIYKSIPENNLSFPQLDLSTYQGVNRLFSFDLSFAQIRKYTFPDLTLQRQQFTGESILGGLAWNNFVFIVLQSTSVGFQVLDAETLGFIDTEPGLAGSRNIAVFDGDPTIVLEISDLVINRYKVNSIGKVIDTDQFPVNLFQPGTQNTCDINNEFYMGGRLSTIVNKEAEVITSLESGVNVFSQMCRFSPDGTKAAIIVTDFNVVNLDLFDISNLPVATKLKTIVCPMLLMLTCISKTM